MRKLLVSDEFNISFPELCCTFDADVDAGDRTVEVGYGIRKLIISVRVFEGEANPVGGGGGGGRGSGRGSGSGGAMDPDALSEDIAVYVEEALGEDLVQKGRSNFTIQTWVSVATTISAIIDH